MLTRLAALFFASLLYRIAKAQYAEAEGLYANGDDAWIVAGGGCVMAVSALLLMVYFAVTGASSKN